jgi:peptidylprolyl isomerase
VRVGTAIFLDIVQTAQRLERKRLVSWPSMSRLPILLACLSLSVFAACGDDDEQESAAPPEETPTATATETPSEPGELDASAISKDLSEKPAVEQPSGSPPTELQTTDIVKGKGKAAKPGDIVSVQYVGNSWSTGAQFDASWDRGGEPFQFPLGAGQVIPGWDQGVAGMKPGGRRLLVIPPDLAYGAQSPSPDIAPNETLIFVVDLKKVG